MQCIFKDKNISITYEDSSIFHPRRCYASHEIPRLALFWHYYGHNCMNTSNLHLNDVLTFISLKKKPMFFKEINLNKCVAYLCALSHA